HPVIPAPMRFDRADGEFAFRSGFTVAHDDPEVAPVVERFCADMTRRTGLRLSPSSDHSLVTIELATDDELAALSSPVGLSPLGDEIGDERYSLTIDRDHVVVRAAESVGVARALATLTQLVAAAPSADRGAVAVPAARIVDAPRYAWRGLSLDLVR